MTDYTTISDTSVDPDAPLTSQLAYAWRDNPIAISEGANGAPRIYMTALQNPSVGSVARYRNNTVQQWSGTTYSVVMTFAFIQSGTVRIDLSHRKDSGTASLVVVNKSNESGTTAVASWSETAGTWTNRTVDVTVAIGDRIDIAHAGSGGSDDIEIANIVIKTNGEYLWPMPGTTGGWLV